MTWKRVAQVVTILLCVLVAIAIVFPVFAQAERYSGPGLISDVLLLDANGKPAANRAVKLYLRGQTAPKATMITDGLGELHVDRKALRVDGILGFRKLGTTLPDTKGWHHSVFWEGDSANHPQYVPRHGGDLPIQWPTPEHPQVALK